MLIGIDLSPLRYFVKSRAIDKSATSCGKNLTEGRSVRGLKTRDQRHTNALVAAELDIVIKQKCNNFKSVDIICSLRICHNKSCMRSQFVCNRCDEVLQDGVEKI